MSSDNSADAAAGHRLLCVLGMHRSGTSVVAQLLHRLGARVGPQLLAAMEGVNDDGFWEDSRVVEFDERLLAACGLRWYDSAAPDLATADPQVIAAVAREARDYFRQHYSDEPDTRIGAWPAAPWVVKDPRQCRLLPFWLDTWNQSGFETVFVHVLRHPYAVAKSLQRRDRMPLEYGVLLWLVYTLEAFTHAAAAEAHTWASVSHSARQPGIVVTFESVCRQPLDLARDLQACCGVRFDTAAPSARATAEGEYVAERGRSATEVEREVVASETIKSHLRHHDATLPTDTGLAELMAFAAATYEALAAPAPALPEAALLGALRTELQALLRRSAGELAMLRRFTGELMASSAESVRIGGLHSEALDVIRDKDKMLEDMTKILAERDRSIDDLKHHIQNLTSYIQDLTHLRFWRLLPRLIRKIGKR